MAERPAARLAEMLAEARRSGVSFAEAWPAAILDAVADEPERRQWINAFEATRAAWAAAWQREAAPRAVRALAVVADDHDREPLSERACARCDAEIPAESDRRARYCSAKCRRRASVERLTAAA